MTSIDQRGREPGTTRERAKTAAPTSLRRTLSVQRIGAVYVLIVSCVVFSLTAPDTFPKWDTVIQIANANSITAIAALGLAVPVAAGLFDLSFPYVMTISGAVCARLVIAGLPVWLAFVLAMATAALMGLINVLIVITMRIDSFIGTLATGSVMAAAVTWITGNNDVSGLELSGPFSAIGQTSVGGFDLSVLFALLIAVGLWLFFEHTGAGRRSYAVGFNYEAARLAGMNAARIRVGALLVSATLAGFAGIVLASTVSSASTEAGSPYLLPAFAAVFLGATQFKRGRVNAWGVVVAVLLLGSGSTGLGLSNAPLWANSLFTGVVLIFALAATSAQRRSRRLGISSRLRRRRQDSAPVEGH
jgi:ribose transport system permease protein